MSKIKKSVLVDGNGAVQLTRKKFNSSTLQMTLLALPAILFVIIFKYIPMAGVFIAFKSVNFADGIFGSPWVGFENFEYFFGFGDAWYVTRNSILYSLAFIVTGVTMSVTMAILLNEITSKKMIKIFQTATFIPYFMSMIVVAYMLSVFFDPSLGVATTALKKVGIDLNIYITPEAWPWIFIFTNLWKGVGYNTIIYYAAIIGIDKSYYEAAEIDGATKFQTIRYITLPLIKPTVIVLVLLALGRIMYNDFAMFYSLPQDIGILYSTTQVLDTFVYKTMISSQDIGLASAVALYQSVVGFILVIVSNKLARKYDRESALF